MADLASTIACVQDDASDRAALPYAIIEALCDEPATIDAQLEKPLQPFLLREHRITPVWIITRR